MAYRKTFSRIQTMGYDCANGWEQESHRTAFSNDVCAKVLLLRNLQLKHRFCKRKIPEMA